MVKFMQTIKRYTGALLFNLNMLLAGVLCLTSTIHGVTKPEPIIERPSLRRQIRELEATKNDLLKKIYDAQNELQRALVWQDEIEQSVSNSENLIARTEPNLQNPMPPQRRAQGERMLANLREQTEKTRKVIEENGVFINTLTQRIEAMQQELRQVEGEIIRLMWQRL